jgi:hypothetical protein
MITMGSPYFVWINTNEMISSWYLLGAVCVTPPTDLVRQQRLDEGPEPAGPAESTSVSHATLHTARRIVQCSSGNKGAQNPPDQAWTTWCVARSSTGACRNRSA